MATYVDIGLAVAQADPSMGWITTFYMEHNWLLTMFAEELQDEIFGAQPFVLAPGHASTRAAGPIAAGDGTYTLSGHWQFATGICHADWVLLSGKVEGDDADAPAVPRAGRRGRGEGHLARRRHGGDRQPRHRRHRRDGARAARVADAAAARCSPGPATRTSLASRSRRSCRSPPRCPRSAPRSERSSCSRSCLFDRVMFGTRRTQSARVPTQVRLANLQGRGRLRRDADARRRGTHAGALPTGRSTSTLLGAAAPPPRPSPTSCAAAATSCARSWRRAVRRCTTSITSCSGSIATST